MLATGAALAPVAARGGETNQPTLAQAREAYQSALAESDRARRTAAFARAETLFAEVAAAHPHSPELLTDWGNAALGAQELGKAAVAYLRALDLDPRLERARRNLDWVRAAMPDWLPRPRPGAMSTLLFWHHALSLTERLVGGAAGFALALLLWAPWSLPPGRRRLLRMLAFIPAAVWLALTASALLGHDTVSNAAVLVADSVPLRSADSAGAPAVLPQALPAGAELTLAATRGDWSRVCLADGSCGWLPSGMVVRVRDE